MNALILENDTVVNSIVIAFAIEHNKMFDSLVEMKLLQHRKPEDISAAIKNADVLIFQSTFHIRRQMEQIVTMITSILQEDKNKKMRFYCVGFLKSIKKFMEYKANPGWEPEFQFTDYPSLKKMIIALVRKGMVYEVELLRDFLGEDYEPEPGKEGEPAQEKTVFSKITYDKATDSFKKMC